MMMMIIPVLLIVVVVVVAAIKLYLEQNGQLGSLVNDILCESFNKSWILALVNSAQHVRRRPTTGIDLIIKKILKFNLNESIITLKILNLPKKEIKKL